MPPCRTQGARPPCKRCRHCDQKLDIADAAGSELDIECGFSKATPVEFFADALARGGDSFNGRKIERGGIDERLNRIQQLAAGFGISRGDPRFDQHLQFPIARAGLVILLCAFERNTHFAQAAVGTQAQIHAIAQAFGGVSGKQLGVLVRDFLVKLFVRDGIRAVGLSVRGVDEHQVDVGAVIKLPAAQLSERDHRHAALARLAVLIHISRYAVFRDQLRADSFVAYVQDGVGEVGQLLGGFRKRAETQNVAQQDPQNLLASKQRQR